MQILNARGIVAPAVTSPEQLSARAAWRRLRRAGLGAVLSAAVAASVAVPAQANERLAWISPGRARAVTWSGAAAPGARELDPSKPVTLAAEELLVLPADPGDRFEIRGDIAAVGVGAGLGDAPDAITWLPLPRLAAGRRELGVQPWSSARFLVVRPAVTPSSSSSPSPVFSVRVAARESAPLAWYRLDEDVADWLLRGGAAPSALVLPLDETGTALAEARPLLRWVEAARDALAPVPGGAVTTTAATWLLGRYLEGSLRVRPLVEPYFLRRSVEVSGGVGEAPLDAAEHATPWRLGAAAVKPAARAPGADGEGARIRLTSAADVLRLGLRARASGPARVIVRAGGAVVREIAWRTSPRMMDRERWTEPRWLRAVLPTGAREVTVEVVQGEVAVAAIGHRQRVGVADFFEARRDRAEILERAAQGKELPAALARVDGAPSRASALAALALAAPSKTLASTRVLVLGEATRWATTPAEARERASAAFVAAQRIPEAIAAPLLRATLERLAAAHADPIAPTTEPGVAAASLPWTGWGSTLALRQGVEPDDAAAITTLGEALSAPADGRRPRAPGDADRFAAAHGDIPGAATRARDAWAREGRWSALDIAAGVTVWSSLEEPTDELPEPAPVPPGSTAPAPPLCDVAGPSGMRWTLLDTPRTRIAVDAPSGTHARVLLRGAGHEPEPDLQARIDGIPLSVHAAAGVASVVAVAPGERTFERPQGAPVLLARIPRTGQAPCASLRDITRWAWVQGEAAFLVPDRDRATVARLLIAPTPVLAAAQRAPSNASASHRLRVTSGDATYEAWVHPGATGAIEVPVPVGASELRIASEKGVLLRASARFHPALPPPDRSTAPRSGAENPDATALLERVRAETRALRTAPDSERLAVKERRATALDLLGFPAFAALDRAPPLEPGDLELEAAPTLAFTLPPGTPPVVPLGLLARLAPLALPPDLGPLRTARGARLEGELRRGIDALTPTAARSSDADALLLALLAERAGSARLGSEAYLRVGLAQRDGRVLSRAATLATDVAAEEGDRLLTLRAFALAELASQASTARAEAGDPWPDPSPAAFARLAPVVSWRAPPRVDLTAGTASLDVRVGPEPDQPLPARVRRALLDAPDRALLITEGAYAQLRFDRPTPLSLTLDGACRLLDPQETPCQLDVRVDGEPQACAPMSPDQPPGMLRCVIPVPSGRHRVEIRPPADSSILAWVRGVAASQPYPGRVMSTWSDIDPTRPLELAFAGPTVVRLRARPAYECTRASTTARGDDPTCRPDVATTAPGGALRFSVSTLGGAGEPPAQGASGSPASSSKEAASASADDTLVEQGEISLDPTEDPWARRAGVTRAPFFWLGQETERRIAILGDGPHILRVASPAGRALVRVEIAVAHKPPRPREQPPPLPPQPLEPTDGRRLRWAPPVGEDPDEGALFLGGYIRTTDGNMSDEDLRAGIRFYELGVDANREILPGTFWAGASAFTRLRTGTSSLGAELRLDTAGRGFIPALSARARLVAQPPALGGRLGISAAWAIPIGEVTLIPWANAALLAVDDTLAGRPDADRDIYTIYTAERRTLASLGARFRFRPTVDAIASIGPAVRVSPLFTAVDRIDLRADLDVLHGRDLWPWVQLGWVGSYRPSNAVREEAFLRNTFSLALQFWSWFARGHRVTLGGETALLVDTPASVIESPRFGLALLLRYDWTGSRGLRDLPPRDLPFRDRLEEGSGVVYREPPATEPRWDDGEE
ncbi:hypothetical protein [Chondromyces crocatus]|uniref:Uncharacterized protein n=1 Tax=Chondromyces crocatus TaxID=52 RepID=A0A0K1E863_CHOCO|nr:hypothetical protein [Chondromyces crocatus]AKT36877.1 uncharacterized protein CMC5_009980 [Chondromyces crocatus]